jgi:multidrug efflux pump subunit AcrB
VNLTEFAVKNRTIIYFAVLLLFIGGIASFSSLGQLEDPQFTVKTAVIVTSYPGASPEEVELEVTDRLEIALQEIKSLDNLESWSWAGYSQIKVNIKPEYWSDQLPQEWDILRKKIREVETSLPPGAGRPVINDDFGDVFGLVLAITGDGFSYAEMEETAKYMKKELSLVKGVARVDLWGVQDKVIYLDVHETQLTELGLTDESIQSTLQNQNMIVDAGSVDVQERRFRIAPTGEFRSPEDIADLVIRPTFRDSMANLTATSEPKTEELIRIRDIGTIRRGYVEPPAAMMRYNGAPAMGISITNVAGANIVDMGRAVDNRLDELIEMLPVGLEVHQVHWMSDVVAASVNGFFINLAEAVLIVLVVLAVAMGWRMGLLIGTALILTILSTFMLMALFGIDLQRMSLGALVIALGMMVDNAIVVADGFVVRLQKGMDRTKAAIESASIPAMPLLGATVVAVMAFYPIFASVESAGEYCRTLFTVVAMSLLSSWIISVTVTPLQCIDMLPAPKDGGESTEQYGSRFYQRYRGLLEKAISFRVIFLGIMVGLLVLALIGFGWVKQLFFPDSSMTKLMIDYWAVQGTRIEQVAIDLEDLEAKLMADERVDSVSSFIGAGPPRFYLPVDPESANPSYGQLIVNVHDFREIRGLVDELDPWLKEHYPDSLVPIRVYGVGPSNTWKFQVRFSGPAVADPAVLRSLGKAGMDILVDEPLAGAVQTDWRQQVQKVVPEYNQERARWAAITREDIANTTKRAFDGKSVGLYREKDDLIPIVLRHVEEERKKVAGLGLLQVQPAMSNTTVPMAQVTDGVFPEWEDPVIARRDRRRTITVQANPIPGVTLPTLRASVVDEFDAIRLPEGYKMEWGGEYEDTVDSQASLIPGIVPAVAIILFIIVALFNAVRPPVIIVLTIPFAAIGISIGLLTFNTPFGFLALLGAMSLAGMMIKNAIVLLDEVNINLDQGKGQYDSVMDAALSRLRPVVLAAATTVLGVIPLLQDVFWIGMAVTIMAGLTFGTVLTMMVVPVLYTTFYRIPSPPEAK